MNLKIIENEVGRIYEVDGIPYPSVTTVLSLSAKEYIEKWRNRVGEDEANKIMKHALSRGNEIHRLAESYLLNGKIETTPYYQILFNPV